MHDVPPANRSMSARSAQVHPGHFVLPETVLFAEDGSFLDILSDCQLTHDEIRAERRALAEWHGDANRAYAERDRQLAALERAFEPSIADVWGLTALGVTYTVPK